MKQSLLTSDARQFTFLMLGEESVVRNFKKVNALFEIHFSEYQPRLKYILAQPEFSGDKASEKIRWTTELFETEPVRMSSLGNDEKERYRELLAKELDAIKEVLLGLPSSVAVLLQKAVTYHSEEAIYCADDMVVIAEWGMHPKGSVAIHGIALDISGATGGAREFMEAKEPMNELEESAVEMIVETPPTNYEDNSSVGYIPPVKEEKPIVEEENPTPEENFGSPVDDTNDDKNAGGGDKKKKRRWLWLLLLIPLLLLLFMRRCGTEDTSTPPPPIEDDDLIWNDDSLSQIVNNRVILLLSDQYPVEDFVKDFRKKYPNKRKYQLYVPDKILPRVVLTLPVEELESMSERLPDEFVKYDLMVIPEYVFGGSRVFNDPAFDDANKSWYFNMINVESAWQYTIGSPDIVVAVIDDGFDLNHPELKEKDIVKPYNSVDHSKDVSPSPSSGHGTHVASTVVGIANNGQGSAGIAPGCKFMPVKDADANGHIAMSAMIDAMLYAIVQKADVINMSQGLILNSPMITRCSEKFQEEYIRTTFLNEESVWKKVFTMGMSNGKDIAFVLAGGNDNILIGVDPIKRTDGTIKVSAVMPNKMKAEFSNYGSRSDLSAPGVNIYNAVSGSERYASYSGTSMASPIVAGAFALMKSLYPSMSTENITKVLQHTGTPSFSRVGNIINLANAMRWVDNNPGSPSPVTPPIAPISPADPNYPTNPTSPLNPNNPQSPLNPKNPNSPFNPNNPSSPLNPNNPNNPISPTDPYRQNPNDSNNPYNPNNPISPFNPSNPNSPLNPNNPYSPINPNNPESPFNPNNPGFTSDPSNPDGPMNPNNPNSPLNPKNPISPFNPTNPNSPLNPSSPNNPNNPINPTNPNSPLNPKNPSSPLNPKNPSSPLNPNNPNNPISPVDPCRQNPNNPNNPYNPNNPTSPFNPTNPNSPMNPTNPNSPINPNNPGSPFNPNNPDFTSDPSNPAGPINPNNPNSPMNPTNPNSPFNPTNPNSPFNPTNPNSPLNPINPTNPNSPLNPGNPRSPLNPNNPSSPINPRNPNNPIGKTDPNRPNPSNPNNPYNPNNPDNPISPYNPTSPYNPSNPNSPYNPNNPTSPYYPNNPNSPLNPSKPGYSSDPTDPTSPYNPNNPNSPFNPDNPTSPMNPNNPNSPLNPNYPGNVIKPHPVDPNDPCPDCTEAQRQYEELMRQLEELKKNNPGCY